MTLKIYETKPNIVWFDFSDQEHYNKDILHAFRYKSILKYMLKIISVRHYKKTRYSHGVGRYPAQQCTEWHRMAIQDHYVKVQMLWLW